MTHSLAPLPHKETPIPLTPMLRHLARAVLNRAKMFNIAQDIGEQTNLLAKEPNRVTELRAELAAWQKQVGAKFSMPNPNCDAAKHQATTE
jgi:hypothetical protein